METIFKWEEPKKWIYRTYSNFSQKDFQSDLLLNVGDEKKNYLEFEKILVETLNKHALKTKIFWGNHKPHINKTLTKAIMKHSKRRNKVNKMKDPKDILKYNKQRNYVVKLNNQWETTLKWEEPKTWIYRTYSNFSQKDFQSDLLLNVGDEKKNYLEFEKILVETLNKHALKTKIFWGNHKPHINKTLTKAIMKHSKRRNKVNKMKDPKDILKYNKQRNYVVKLNNQSKHFDSLSPFQDSRSFWKSYKPYFSNKLLFGDWFSTGHFSQISLMTRCKILFFILVSLKSSTNSS